MRLAFIDGRAYYPATPLLFPKFLGHGAGMGDASTDFAAGIMGAQQGAATAMQLGGGTAADIVGGVQAGLDTIAPFTGPAAPVIMAISSIIGPIAQLFKGCGQTCIQATKYADQAATAFDQVLHLYYSQPVRTVAMQQAALSGIKGVMQQLYQACSSPSLGTAGQKCISERLTPTGSPPGCITAYGAPMTQGDPGYAAGLPCNMYTFYINRIQGDTMVQPDPIAPGVVSTSIDPVTGQTTTKVAGMPLPLVLGVAALVLALVLGGGK